MIAKHPVRWLCTLAAAALSVAARPALAADLVVWHAYRTDEKAAFEKVIAQYNAKKGAAGPHVTAVAVPFDGFADRISVAVPRGKGPDLFIYPQDRLGGWIEAGKTVESIDFYVDAKTREKFIPTTLQALSYRGAVYGLPLNYKVVALFYNKKLVQTPPRTTAELEAIAKKLTAKPAKFGLVYDYGNFYFHAALASGFGGRVFDALMRPVIDSPENVRALKLLLDWQTAFLPAEPSATVAMSLFNDGRAGMMINGPWSVGEIAPGLDYDITTLPTISEAGDQPMRPWMTVEGLFVCSPSTQKEAAYDFAKYVTDTDAARILAVEGHQLPANQVIHGDPAIAGQPRLRAFFEQVRVAIPMPNAPEMTLMWGHALELMGNVLRRAETPEAALAKAQEQVVRDVASLRRKP